LSIDARNQFFVGVATNPANAFNTNVYSENSSANSAIVGMLATSLDVNVGLITKIYDIEAFPDIIIQKQERPLPYPDMIGVIGDLRIARRADIYTIATQLNCCVFDAEKCLPPLDAANSDEQSALAAIRILKNVIAQELAKPERSGPNVPLACIIVGFPRCDEEATAVSNRAFAFDSFLELGNGPESIDIQDDDGDTGITAENLQFHVDAVETLLQLFEDFSSPLGADPASSQMSLSNRSSDGYEVSIKESGAAVPKWKKAPCDGYNGDLYRCVLDELTHIVGLKAQQIELWKIKDLEEPPQANAFAITVFAMHEDFESRAEDLLTIAFEENLSYDYCVFITPCNAKPSRLTQNMVQAPVRVGVSFDQCLYIMHREVLVSRQSITVRRTLESTMPAITNFLTPLLESTKDGKEGNESSSTENLMGALKASFRENDVELKDNPAEVSCTATMRGEIIAVVCLTRRQVTNDEVNWLRANYRIEELVAFERHRLRAQAYITSYVGDPLLSPMWARFIVREIMRMYRKTLLYYLSDYRSPTPKELQDVMTAVSPLARMQPFRDDYIASLPYILRPGSVPGQQQGATVEYPLFCVSKNMLTKRKAIVNTRIVVVGGNASVYPLLEYLVLHPTVYLTSIQLVIEDPHNALDSNRLESNFKPVAANSFGLLSSTSTDGFMLRRPSLEAKDAKDSAAKPSDDSKDAKDSKDEDGSKNIEIDAKEAPAKATSSKEIKEPEVSASARSAREIAPAKNDTNGPRSSVRNSLSKDNGTASHIYEGIEAFGCLSAKEADIPLNRELLAMGLAHRVTIVKGRLTDIDRDNRAIVISDEIVVEYDLLVLAAGVQGTYAFLVSCV
jgi:hypothetical protein